LILEKNETIQIKPYRVRPDTEAVNAGDPKCSVREFVERGAAHQGGSYWLYDHRNNNCQIFVINTLSANHILDANVRSFVEQDVKSIFDQLPGWLNDLASSVTGLAGKLRTLLGLGPDN
jgi:hypothetical protein